MSSQPEGKIRFGPFELDVLSAELRNGGTRVRLPQQPFQILLMLLERPGALISREEIRCKLWSGATVVEFDHSINAAVNRLRNVLCDSAGQPRYIETLPRLGYRFIGQLQAPCGTAHATDDRPEAAVPVLEGSAASGSRSPRSRIRLWMALGAGLLIIATGAQSYYSTRVRNHRSIAALPQQIVPFTAEPGIETMPAFSPDGKQVAYVRTEHDPQNWRGFWKVFLGPSNIYLKVVEAGTESRLTKNSASDSFPAWSPDGQYIAFFRRTSSGDVAYYLVSAFGGPERRIGAAAGASGGLAWFPDGKRLAVAEVSQASQSAPLLSISTETGERRTLTSPPNAIDLHPTFSPDGKSLAFVRGVDFSNGDVYLMPATGGPARRLTFDGTWKRSIAWTRDGRELLYSSERLWRIPVKGGEPQPITTGDQMIGSIAVAPRGNRLAYVSYNAPESLWRVELTPPRSPKSPAGTEFARSTRFQDGPHYSPDGRRIAFLSGRSGGGEIWTADSNGGNLVRLTDLKHTGSPAWSPDGAEIAFDTRISGNPDIWVVHADGGAPRRITTRPDEDVVPSWSHDGKWIYFASNRTGQFQIWKAPAAGERPSAPAVQVTTGGGFRAIETPDGKYLYFAKGRGKPGLWRRAIGNKAIQTEEPVMPLFEPWGWWTLTPHGLFFLVRNGPVISLMHSGPGGAPSRRLADIPGPIYEYAGALTVSPDGRYLVYTRMSPENADIMLIENFR